MRRAHILSAAAVLSLAAAALQLALGVVPRWSVFFGAPESLVAHPAALLGASVVVAGLFGTCAAYSLSGAGYIRRLPLLRSVLLVVGIVLLLRGWVIIPMLLAPNGMVASGPDPRAALWSSAAFLLLALLYLAGVILNWRVLRPNARGPGVP